MASKKIREYDAKRLILARLPKGIAAAYRGVLVGPTTKLDALPKQFPWLVKEKLAVKPDQLFGKRKQYNLVLLHSDFAGVKKFILAHRNKKVTIGKATDALTHFLIEPMIAHQQEYYISITSQRTCDVIYFSAEGGFNIEERWDRVKKIAIPVGGTLSTTQLKSAGIPEKLHHFMVELYRLYVTLDFTYLEINPFCIDVKGTVHLLDMVAQLDGCAHFLHPQDWKNVEFPRSFGNKSYPEEEFISKLDEESGASLKLTILNPQGRIWNILSGGGASIIYLDTIVDAGLGKELANYGEYSGNPTREESYQYAKTVLDLMTRKAHPKGKLLFIAGAIANFTDVKETFMGIVRALKEYQEKLRTQKIRIIVRRGGPNYEQGLKLIHDTGREMKVPIEVHGPETPMVSIVAPALEKL
ncbi:TPA: ATPase [Candidatus Woesearchaeota archaeon]|nr:ATPase [Candidatus Woesearchaeota archaeon]